MFGRDFLFGASLSGFQFEMGMKGSEDPNTDWFVWVRDPLNISSGLVSGDLPEDGPAYWNLYEKDHEAMKELGMNAIRIGVEWSRIFPKSTEEVEVEVEMDGNDVKRVEVSERAIEELEKLANMEAVEHYRKIMKDAKDRGFFLIVNLNHFTLPIWIHDPIEVRKVGIENAKRSGWYSEKTVVEFAKFAAFCAKHFGDLVDAWSTMNEPHVVSSIGYILTTAGFPPAYPSFEAFFRTMVNQAQAHARAYDVLKKTGKEVGLIYSFSPVYPKSEKDERAAEMANYIQNFWFMDSITFGKFGEVPGFIEGKNREDMKGRFDFIGVNYYTRTVVESGGPLGWRGVAGYGHACAPSSRSADGYPTSEFGWEVFPKGLYDALKMLHGRYKMKMIVTENGIADSEDRLRPYFLVSHLYEVEKALEEGMPVFGYLHWSIIDNYEWAQGYSKRFGLFYVDFKTKERFPRPSAFVYSRIISDGTTKKMIGGVPYPV